MTSTVNLPPCPFCGGEPKKDGQHIYTHWRDSNPHKANEAWHQAASPEPVVGLLDHIAELERADHPVAIPNQPGLNIDLTRMREVALHAQVHGVVFKADGSQVRQVLDFLHERTLEIKRLNTRIAELEAQPSHTPTPRDCQRPECMSRGCFGHCMKDST